MVEECLAVSAIGLLASARRIVDSTFIKMKRGMMAVMKRLGRWVFDGIVVLSAVLCLMTGVIWVRSFWMADWIISDLATGQGLTTGQAAISSDQGEIFLSVSKLATPRRFVKILPIRHESMGDSNWPSDIFGVATFAKFGWQFVSRSSGIWVDARGLRFVDGSQGGSENDLPGTQRTLVLPDYFIFIITAGLPLIWAWRWLRTRRLTRVGHCVHCGYDLRATPDRSMPGMWCGAGQTSKLLKLENP
jgi:hypothetical protein